MAIREDDLEALGAIAGYAGGFLTELSKGASTRGEAARLVHFSPDPRNMIRNALNFQTDEAGNVDINNVVQNEMRSFVGVGDEVAVNNAGPEILPQRQQIPQNTPAQYVMPSPAPNRPALPPQQQNGPEQMEFSFVNRIVNNYGSVGDVINHFDERLDKIEESLRYIRSFMVDVRSSMGFIKDNMSVKRTPNSKKKRNET